MASLMESTVGNTGSDPSRLVAHGHSLRDQGDLQHAIQFYQRALETTQEGEIPLECLNSLGECYAEQGDHDNAIQVFQKCVEVDPEHSGHAWMYLGQFMEGFQALESFNNGVNCFKNQIHALQEKNNKGDDAEKQRLALMRQLVSGYCTMAELFMTDLCFEDDAETSCEQLLQQALQYDEKNIEALSTLANFRLCQQKPDLAKQAIQEATTSLSKLEEEINKQYVLDNNPASAASNSIGSANDTTSSGIVCVMPPYSTRSGLAKAAMEAECYSEALNVLEGLLAEDDTDLELWFLVAEAYLHSGDPQTALQYVEDALQEADKRIEKSKEEGNTVKHEENQKAKDQLKKLQEATKKKLG
eukprot:gb/GECG01013726.1/.p1 GENE.gb/GECG01013726.1/~~gb/GECG01013726.1/.p1  ORF type:complete len:358 (+),score=75.81 gb/GECG01013726.1/:1-1074(+)